MSRLIGLLGAKGAGKDTAAKLLVSHFGYIQTSFAAKLYEEIGVAYGVPVEFLSDRDTKETPLEDLQLARCGNMDFVETALETLRNQRRRAAGSLPVSRVPTIPRRFPHRNYHGALTDLLTEERRLDMVCPRSPRWVLQLWGTEFRRKSRFGYLDYWVDRGREFVDGHPGRDVAFSDVRMHNEVMFIRSRGGLLIRIRRPDIECIEQDARVRGDSGASHSSEIELQDFPVDVEVENVEGQPEALLDPLRTTLVEAERAA